MLKKDLRLDANRVFLIGHSQGGMLAPRIDAEGGDLAGLFILAGTPRTLAEVIINQNEDSSLDYTIEGSDEVNTLTRLSRFTRWEFDVTQSIIDDFFQATHSEKSLKEFQK
ncbi:hypothetical protein HQN89_13560 [Paenibacillus frigoriresistens]|nr:hypothetical protein [Paenibacillus frigoriresistens]